MPSLYTMMLRNALYFEGAKRGAAQDFGKVIRELDSEVSRIINSASVTNLGDLTKTDFNRLIVRLRKSMTRVLSRGDRQFNAAMRQLADIETTAYQAIFRKNTGERIRKPPRDRTWSAVTNRDMGATGGSMSKASRQFQNSTINQIESMLRRGYADKLDLREVQLRIRGTKAAGYRNGVLSKVSGWADSYSSTVFHHVGSSVKNDLAARYYEEYDWISVLDEVTTDVCISRAGQRYKFGEGPIPPAHYKCRSEIVPVDPNDDSAPQSFADWLREQPGDFLSDVFKAGRHDLDNVKVITLDKFKDKLEFVLVG